MFSAYNTYFTTSMSYAITGKGDGTYYYKVWAGDNAGNREDSSVISVTVALPSPPPPILPAPPWGVIDINVEIPPPVPPWAAIQR